MNFLGRYLGWGASGRFCTGEFNASTGGAELKGAGIFGFTNLLKGLGYREDMCKKIILSGPKL